MPAHDTALMGKRFLISIGITLAILLAEVIGGYWTGSLALLSDAAHVFMDVFALALSYIALRLSSLPRMIDIPTASSAWKCWLRSSTA